MKLRVAALLFAATLAVGSLAGCGNKETTEDTKDTSSDETGEGTLSFDFSKGLDDYGYFKGLTASDYVKDLHVDALEVDVRDIQPKTDDAVKQVTDYIAGQYKTEVKNRAIVDGDLVNIDYSGSVDGIKFQGGTAQNQEVTAGSNQFIDDFLTQIIGHMPGDTFDVNVTFPDPYPNDASLAGRPAVFEVTINAILELPVLTDELIKTKAKDIAAILEKGGLTVKGAADFTTFRELDDALNELYFDKFLEDAILAELEKVEVEKIPEAVETYVREGLNYTYASQYGMTFDQMLENNYMTEEQASGYVEGNASFELVMQAIYEEREYRVDESAFKEVTGSDDNTEAVKRMGRGYIARVVMMQRGLEYLKSVVKVVEP